MAQYIDKSIIDKELRRRIQESLDAGGATRGVYLSERMKEDSYILSFIDTLKVKEVDLEKALSDLDKDIKEFITTGEFERESKTSGHYWAIAKHAFLFGLKSQKGE